MFLYEDDKTSLIRVATDKKNSRWGYDVDVSREQFDRWEIARMSFESAQAEMREMFGAAEAQEAAIERAAEEAEDRIRQADEDEWRAQRIVKEAALDAQFGTKDFTTKVTMIHWQRLGHGPIDPGGSRVGGHTVHRVTCRHAKDYSDLDLYRKPDAINMIGQVYSGVVTKACKVCCKDLIMEKANAEASSN